MERNLAATADLQTNGIKSDYSNIHDGDDWWPKTGPSGGAPQEFTPAASTTTAQFAPSQKQHNSNQKQCQRLEQIPGSTPVARPWSIWFIGCVDILSVVLFTTLAVRNFNQSGDPDYHMQFIFLCVLPVLGRLLMGFSLLTGLRSDNDSTTHFYCKLWIVCQLPFLLYSLFEVVIVAVLYAYASDGSRMAVMLYHYITDDLPVLTIFLLRFGLFFYRFICFLTVQLFVNKLKRSETETLEAMNAYFKGKQLVPQPSDDGEEDTNRKEDYNAVFWAVGTSF